MSTDDDPRLAPSFGEQSGLDPTTINAVGKVTDALETVEIARGYLYAFHRFTGTAEREIDEAANQLAEAGHGEFAERIRAELAGRNVLAGRWTFQVVEEYDEGFYEAFKQLERDARVLVGGYRHLHEAALKRELSDPQSGGG